MGDTGLSVLGVYLVSPCASSCCRFYREHTDGADYDASLVTYAGVWNGLRVRIGMNYGYVQVEYDRISKGYDYYGPVVNAAARIESMGHGGQVLMPTECYQLIEDSNELFFISTQSLGLHLLRSIHSPLNITQVLPARFTARRFPGILASADSSSSDRMHSTMVSDSFYPPGMMAEECTV